MINNSAQITFSRLPGIVVEVTPGQMTVTGMGVKARGNLDADAGLGLIESNAMELLKLSPELSVQRYIDSIEEVNDR